MPSAFGHSLFEDGFDERIHADPTPGGLHRYSAVDVRPETAGRPALQIRVIALTRKGRWPHEGCVFRKEEAW